MLISSSDKRRLRVLILLVTYKKENIFITTTFCKKKIIFCLTYYRVSIKSFPDYKHLLQENYVEYKHIFFLPLLMLASKILCHVFIVMLQLHNLLVSKWRQWGRKPSVFCGITKQNRRSQCSGNSEMSTDVLRQMLKASKHGIQSL